MERSTLTACLFSDLCKKSKSTTHFIVPVVVFRVSFVTCARASFFRVCWEKIDTANK